MRRVALALVSTVAALVGLLSFKTHTASNASAPTAISATEPDTGTSTGTSGGTSTGSSGAGTKSTSTKTVTGDAVDTRWGPVQVRITVTNGKLTSVSAIVYPTGNPRDQEINATAIPALNKEAIATGSAKIDMISGATYTSTGYINSLQSALDKAGA
jgi:uncharacterized protein with FMN-binding domain